MAVSRIDAPTIRSQLTARHGPARRVASLVWGLNPVARACPCKIGPTGSEGMAGCNPGRLHEAIRSVIQWSAYGRYASVWNDSMAFRNVESRGFKGASEHHMHSIAGGPVPDPG